MALFDGDIVTVTTPDGRQVQMPASLAQSFSGLAPANIAPVPPPDPGDTAPIATASTPPIASSSGPVTSPDQVPAGPAQAPRPTPVTEPGPEMGTQQVAPPAPPRVPTNAELAKNGPGQTLLEQNAAIDKQQKAINESAQIQADEATREGAVMAARDAKTQQILEERARQAAQNEAELNARIQQRDQLANQIANTRIDRSVDHPIWSAIGLILSTFGTAMKLRPGEKWDDPAYNTLMQQIDRKVDAQMKDLDNRRAALGQMNVGITEQRQHNMDRLSEIDVRRDAAIQQAQQMVQTMATQMKSPLALAQAKELAAKLDQERATMRGQAAERAQAQINTERQMAQQAQFHKESMDLQRQQMAMQERDRLAAIAEKALEQKNAAATKQAKDVAERGVWDPRTADVQLDPDGQRKLAQANQIEAQARQNPQAAGLEYIKSLRRQASTPEQGKQIDALEARVRTDPNVANQAAHQYAQDLRSDAKANNAVLAPDKATADKVRPVLEAAQGMTDQIDQAVKVLEAGPSAFNREAWAGLKTNLSDIAVKYAKLAGERVSVKAIDQAMENIISFDPDSWFSREASKGKAVAALKSLQQIVTDGADSTLKGAGIKSNWKPVARSEQGIQLNVDDKTASEIGQEQNPGLTQRLGARLLTAGTKSYEDLSAPNEDAAPLSRYAEGGESGLSPNATVHIKALVARASTAGDQERAQIVDALKNPIAAGLREGGRPTLAYGMLDVISATNPGLYQEVVAALPTPERKLVEKNDAAKRELGRELPAIPASAMTPAPPVPTDEQLDELRRIERERDTERETKRRRDAQKAYEQISARAAEGGGR